MLTLTFTRRNAVVTPARKLAESKDSGLKITEALIFLYHIYSRALALAF